MVEWKTIGEISSNVFAGGTPSTKHEEYYDGDIPWIRSGEIDFNVITKAERNITEKGLKNSSAKLIRKGSVVMAMTGATVAKSAIVDFETSANQSVCAIETDESIANYKYVYFYLSKDYFKIKSSAQGALTSLNLAMIKQIEIPIPSFSDQQRIVEQLDTFTSSIENLKEQIAQRRKQYEYYRDQLLDLEGKEGVEMKMLGDIMQIVRGASPRPIQNYITTEDDGVNWIKIGDVSPNDKYITKTNEKITKEGAKKSRFLQPGAFILSNSMSFGRPYILQIEGCIHDGWIAMSEYEKHVSSGYLYEVLNADITQRYWCKKANNGGAMTNLNSDIVKETPIPIPSLSEQQRIVSILDTFEASIQNLEAQLVQRQKQYEYYRNKLLTFE